MPKVSVIIPNYNHARYLDQRIQSVLNQTYQDFEVIILDDCSTDNSLEVIDKYKDNPKISQIIVNEKNSGSTFKQWDKGFNIARGNIIWIAESDDYCETDMLERLVECWKIYPQCSVIQAASRYVDEFGNIISDCENCMEGIVYEKGYDAIKRHMVCSNYYIPNASAVTFKKSVALSIPDDYKDYKSSGDRLFWIHMLEKGGLCTIGIPMSMYRQHNENRVSSRMEVCGIQCKENYYINRYLHKKGFIKGRLRLEEYDFYWKYIHRFPFENEKIRQELINLWFPCIILYKALNKLREWRKRIH